MNRLIPEINNLYACSPLGFKSVKSKKFTTYMYRNKEGELVTIKEGNPTEGPGSVYRHAMDYKVLDSTITFIVISDKKSGAKKFFDKSKEQIEKDNKKINMLKKISIKPLDTNIKWEK